MTDNLNSESDKIKIRLDHKLEPLHNNATPVEYRVWTNKFAVFFCESKLDKADIIEPQQALLKLLDSQIAAELRGRMDYETPIFRIKQQAPLVHGTIQAMDIQTLSCFDVLDTHFRTANPIFKCHGELLKLKPNGNESFSPYMVCLKEHSEECHIHNITHEDVILLITTMHCDKEEPRKHIKRYINPSWLAVERLAENYKRSMIDKEPHKLKSPPGRNPTQGKHLNRTGPTNAK